MMFRGVPLQFGKLAWNQAHKRIRYYLISALMMAPAAYNNIGFLQDLLSHSQYLVLSSGLGALALIASFVQHDS